MKSCICYNNEGDEYVNYMNVNQSDLSHTMRMLWEQHIFWTRLLIISILESLKDLDATQQRLLRNPVDLGNVFAQFYGSETQKIITDLLTEHLVIGAQLVTAFRNNNTQDIERLNTLWYHNANRMAQAFASINPYFIEDELRDMLYTHLDLTKNEVSLRLQGKFEEDTANFDQLEQAALAMADYFTQGLINQFQPVFTYRFY